MHTEFFTVFRDLNFVPSYAYCMCSLLSTVANSTNNEGIYHKGPNMNNQIAVNLALHVKLMWLT